jgi:hypothetical protein
MAVYTQIDNPELFYQTKLYTGDGNSTQAITLDGDEDMQPDLVWIKNRTDAHYHNLNDSVRGVGAATVLRTNSNAAESGTSGHVSVIGSDGFTVAEGSSDAEEVNTSSDTYVAWCWKESATAGFDIVGYTGNGTDDTDISHNLSAVPKMIIVKNRDANDDWQVYHAGNTSAPETDYLVLNEEDATADNADRWSDEAPTSSVFTLGDGAEVNTNTENYIAYCFAPKQGFSAMNSYIGNGDVDGPFIYTGFRPTFVLIKRSTAQKWVIIDNKRNPINGPDGIGLKPDASAADETTSVFNHDRLANGIKIRSTWSGCNTSGTTYIYMAFAEAQFVNSNGVPCNAR